jgi:mannose/fructose/N-acetylgalactosamine-specific phosphotransferase system component IIC
MSPLTIVVTAFAVALVVMSGAFMGGAVIVAVPIAILVVAVAVIVDVVRKRKGARTMESHQPGEDVEFTERDRRTLVSE